MIARIIVSGAAVLVAALIVPGIRLNLGESPVEAIITVGLLGLIFGLVNAYLRPVLRIVSLPLNLLTLGLFSFLLNAGLLLLVAYLADLVTNPPPMRLGAFPPTIDADALVAAVLGSIVISAAATVMSLLTPDA
jgi:putative membrane protein